MFHQTYGNGYSPGNNLSGQHTAQSDFVNIAGSMYPASIIIERRNEEVEKQEIDTTKEISEENIKELLEQALKDMLGMKTDDLKAKLCSIDTLRDDFEREKKQQAEIRVNGMSSRESNESYYESEAEDDDYEEEAGLGAEAEKDDEPGIAVENQLRIKEQSAKAIEFLTDHMHSKVWQGCSRNTYGFLIRVLLLSGSRFKRQLIPETWQLIPLALFGVVFSACMQFILAWYLWTRLPQTYPTTNGDGATLKSYDGTADGRKYYESPPGFARVPLPAYEYPNYQFANDVCRTVPIVQLVCIGLFMFSILNNVPAIIKNIMIIYSSERFVSEDEDGITKLHYWRESSYSCSPENHFLMRFCDQHFSEKEKKEFSEPARVLISAFICEMYFKGEIISPGKKQLEQSSLQNQDTVKLFAGAARRRWMLRDYIPAVPLRSSLDGLKKEMKKCMATVKRPFLSLQIPRSFFEVNETRSFVAEALRLIDNENNVKSVEVTEKIVSYQPWKNEINDEINLDRVREGEFYKEESYKEGTKSVPVQFSDEARCNLVRLDYLKPSLLRPAAKSAADTAADTAKAQSSTNVEPKDLKLSGPETQIEATFFKLLKMQLGKQFEDITTAMVLLKYPAFMVWFRIVAFVLGVLPEVASLAMILVAGIPYILWSGFKVDSDTQGMEEIILATLAIVFIYDIDDMVYDHILPELFKEAHERDRFELSRGWISSETYRILNAIAASSGSKNTEKLAPPPAAQAAQNEKDLSKKSVKRMMRCNPLKWVVKNADWIMDKKHEVKVDIMMAGTAKDQSTEKLKVAQSDDDGENKQSAQTIKEAREKEEKVELERGMMLLMEQFNVGMKDLPMTAQRALDLSVSDHWNDLYLARAYPFLYARKMRYALANHLWERILVFYGISGAHYFVLAFITLVIVGGYRTLAHCERFGPGVFGTHKWPETCLLNIGPTADKFSQLNASSAERFMAVSCGVSGYVPDTSEWEKNKDYMLKEEEKR